MVKKYTHKQFQNDLKKLAYLIEGYNTTQMGGKRDKDGQLIKYRTFTIVAEGGQQVTPHGLYRVRKFTKTGKKSNAGPGVAANHAGKSLCKKIMVNRRDYPKCEGRTFTLRETTRGGKGKLYGPYKIVVYEYTPAESKKRTNAVIRLATDRLMKEKNMSRNKAIKEVRKTAKKVTHKISAVLAIHQK